MHLFKKDFPIFKTYPNLVYLDSASTAQKPNQVIDAIVNHYKNSNANIHRGIYTLSESATAKYEEVRNKVKTFINAEKNQGNYFY
jgi:cysteine desulfurase/selenocysteine lyase